MNDVKRLVAQVARMPGLTNNYRPQRSCGQGYVFTHVCDSVHRGGSSGSPPCTGRPPLGLGRENPPRDLAGRTPPPQPPPGPGRENPPQTRQTPPSPGPPRPGRHPPPGPVRENPPWDLADTPRPVRENPPPALGPVRENPPPGKKTAA